MIQGSIETNDGRQLTYAIHGPHPFEGATTFFMHGNPGSQEGPFPRAIRLHLLGVRIIGFNRPGYGHSTRQEGRSIADTATDVEALADSIGVERFGVFGRSGGVPHALGCAALLGDRVSSVLGLVGIAPQDDTFDRELGMTDTNAAIHASARNEPQQVTALFENLADKTAQNPYAFMDDFLWEQLADADKEVFLRNPQLYAAQVAAYKTLIPQRGAGWVDDTLALNKPWGFKLRDITQPTLLWHGEQDVFSPYENSLHMAGLISQGQNEHSRVVIAPGKGHFNAFGIMEQALAWQREMAAD